MGYDTEFDGEITITPPLNEDEIAYLTAFSYTLRVKRLNGPYDVNTSDRAADVCWPQEPPEGQPGLRCQWIPTTDGTAIEWDQGEKFYYAVEWMQYLIDHFLKAFAHSKRQTTDGIRYFTFGDHVLNGEMDAQGNDEGDEWTLVVRDNRASVEPARWEPSDVEAWRRGVISGATEEATGADSQD